METWVSVIEFLGGFICGLIAVWLFCVVSSLSLSVLSDNMSATILSDLIIYLSVLFSSPLSFLSLFVLSRLSLFLSFDLSVYLFHCPSTNSFIFKYIWSHAHLFFYPSICLFILLSICLCIYLSIYLSLYHIPIYPSIFLSTNHRVRPQVFNRSTHLLTHRCDHKFPHIVWIRPVPQPRVLQTAPSGSIDHSRPNSRHGSAWPAILFQSDQGLQFLFLHLWY